MNGSTGEGQGGRDVARDPCKERGAGWRRDLAGAGLVAGEEKARDVARDPWPVTSVNSVGQSRMGEVGSLR